MNKEFLIVFQLSKTKTFEVDYYTLGNNTKAHFKTSADEFAKNKKDYIRCGQAQDDILPPYTTAYKFYKKWDKKHLQDLTKKQYKEMLKDLEVLKQKYSYIIKDLGEYTKPYSPHINFYTIAEFTKQDPKKHNFKEV